jgi:branched-chain amino acid transport system ATP-binding protein
MTMLLETRGLTVNYGGVKANVDIDIDITAGTLVGLIGANGAGKTTLVDAITGFAQVTSGSVLLHGQEITRMAPEVRARRGMMRTFQSLELFDDLTVWDNLRVACDETHWWSFLADLLLQKTDKKVDVQVRWALRAMNIEHLAGRLPKELSHGQRKLAGVARALAVRPELLLLDEPAAGLDAEESAELSKSLRGLVDQGITLFLIDHDMGLMMTVCDDVYVLDFGRIIAHGAPSKIRTHPVVIAAYLGTRQVRSPESAAPQRLRPEADR